MLMEVTPKALISEVTIFSDGSYENFSIFFGFGWGALPLRPPGFAGGGQSPP